MKFFDLSKQYFLFPVYGYDGADILFPKDINHYNIFTVDVCARNQQYYFKILDTMDSYFKNDMSDEYFLSYTSSFLNTKNTIRQYFVVFKTLELAIAFRYKYLTKFLLLLNNYDIILCMELTNIANDDYNYIVVKNPELFI